MSLEDFREIIRDAGLGYLATVENGQPRVRPMMPAVFGDGTILAATARRSPKLKQIEKNNSFEICFVDKKLSQLRIQGKVSVSNDIKKKEWLSGAVPMLKSYFPKPDDPNFTLLVLKPEKILLINVGEEQYTEIKP